MKRIVVVISLIMVVMSGCSGGGGGSDDGNGGGGAVTPAPVPDGSIPWVEINQLLQKTTNVPFTSAESGGGTIGITTMRVSESAIQIDLTGNPPVKGMGVTVWLKKGKASFVSNDNGCWVLEAKDSSAAWQTAKSRLIDGSKATSTMFGIVFLDDKEHEQIGRLRIEGVGPLDHIALHFTNK